jgi:hypothetical protein
MGRPANHQIFTAVRPKSRPEAVRMNLMVADQAGAGFDSKACRNSKGR